MAVSVSLLLPNDLLVEDDEYIEMEVSSYSNFICNTSTHPSHFPMEFEFQMSSSSMEIEPTTSPADELFYKGKLLPLHLPPRLQMVEKLLMNSTSVYQDFYTTTLTNTATTTPFESCNVSPSESCRISQELNPEECSFDYSTEALTSTGRCYGENHRKKSSSLSLKLKAYRFFLKSLFSVSGCSSESCSAAKVADEGSVLRATERLDRSRMMKSTKKAPFGQIRHRRSFSLAVKQQHSTNKSSSSSTSSCSSSSPSSTSVQNLQFLKRSNSVINVEVESPIQGAIAHCKKSQLISSEKAVSELNSL